MIGATLFAFCVVYGVWLAVVYPRLLQRLAEGKRLPTGAKLPDITVIIPTFNEAANIAAKIQDVLRQDYPAELLTLLVIDNGSTDDTVALARTAGAVVMTTPHRGKITAINEACAQAPSDIVVVTDADTTLGQGALRHLVGPLADPRIGATGGYASVGGAQGWWLPSKVAYHKMDWELRTAEGLVDTCISLDGKLMAWRLSALPGFPKASTVDDLVLTLELRQRGFRAVIVRDAVVHEQGPPTWRGELEQIRRRAAISMPPIGKYMGIMFWKQGGYYGRLIFPTRRFLAIFLPFMLLYSWLYLFTISPVLGFGCTVAAGGLIGWRKAYFPLLQQLGILLAWFDFMTGRIAPAAAWQTHGA